MPKHTLKERLKRFFKRDKDEKKKKKKKRPNPKILGTGAARRAGEALRRKRTTLEELEEELNKMGF